MDLIIDANILMSALISSQGKTFDLIFNDKFKLFAPEFLFEEIEKYKEEIIDKSNIFESDFNVLLSLLTSRINIISKDEFLIFMEESKLICPDENDKQYFALALKLKCSIWTNDKKLKEQDKIKIYNTSEILELI